MRPTLLASHPAAASRQPTAGTTATAARVDTRRACANAPVFTHEVDEVEAWARQASFASGFGGGLAEAERAPVAAVAPSRRSAVLQAALQQVTERLRGWLTALRGSMRARETARQLAELDDRQLRDIGISRSEILSAALESERAVAQYSARVHTQRVA